MRVVPPFILTPFESELVNRSVPDAERIYYKKWLRFYWDFCKKYDFLPSRAESLPLFLDKLREKTQPAHLCLQAKSSVELFFDLDVVKAQSASTPSDGVKEGEIIDKPKQKQARHDVDQTVKPSRLADSESLGEEGVTVTPRAVPLDGTRHNEAELPTAGVNEKGEAFNPPKKSGASWLDIFGRLKEEVAIRHYSPKTLKAYQGWVRKFQTFVKSKDVTLLVQKDVVDFLTHLAVEKKVSASSQNQAFNALLFLFKNVFKREFGEIKGVVRPKRKPYIPVVLTRGEIDAVLGRLSGPYLLPAKLLYACGLRISECLKLRVQDFNFEMGVLTVHNGKGKKDRTVPLPRSIYSELQEQLAKVSKLHDEDLGAGYSGVFLPNRLGEKYKNAAKEYPWQWFFPGKTLTLIEKSGEHKRYHLHDSLLQKAIRSAVKRAKLTKRVTAHTFRHSFASHLLQANYDIRTIQVLMGHSDVKTTMIYVQTVPSLTIKDAKSPLDFDVE